MKKVKIRSSFFNDIDVNFIPHVGEVIRCKYYEKDIDSEDAGDFKVNEVRYDLLKNEIIILVELYRSMVGEDTL